MVVHLKDRPNSTPLDLLVALMENEQNDALANLCKPLQRPPQGHATQIIPEPRATWISKIGTLIERQEAIPHDRCSWDEMSIQETVAMPNGIYITRAYTNMKPGSRQVSVIIRNMTSRPIHLLQGKVVTRVVASNAVPNAEPSPDLLKKLEMDAPTKPHLSMEERHKLLIAALEKDGGLEQLKMWPPKLAAKATRLLLEYQDIFSLEPHEIGCTDTTEHDIELLDHEPFKERFRHITLPLVEEVRQHIQEMLDGGAICPSQSPWCNAVVLVRKKDGSLCFCIDFRRLNAKMKKDSYPLPRMQETMESMVGIWYFSCMDLKSGFWQVKMSEKARQYTAFTVGSMGVYEFLRMLHGLCNAPATFQRLMQNCLGELNLTYTLIYLDDVYSRTEEEHLTRLRVVF